MLEQSDRENLIAQAIGHTVVAAASFEKALLAEIYRRQLDADLPIDEVEDRFDSAPGGLLLRKLREQGLEPALADRIESVLKRRNGLVHGVIEDLDVIRAMSSGENIKDVVASIEELGSDCLAVSRELQHSLATFVEARHGVSLDSLAVALLRADLSEVPDPEQRATLEMARALIELAGWTDARPPEPAD
jgi:hypothetical protein